MSTPRLEVDLDRVGHNARTLVDRLRLRGIAVTGVTKAMLGDPRIARTLVAAGVRTLGDSRIGNLTALRRAGVTAGTTLIRTPMLSQVDRVVRFADVSCNSDLTVIAALSAAAERQHVTHRVVLMVELGDLREGVMPGDLVPLAREVLRLPHVRLHGVGTNLACRSGVVPDAAKMAELSGLASSIEASLGLRLEVVSGGNSANLAWALGDEPVGRVNDLRLGESILLGREPLERQPIDGLYTDAFAVVAEVIESSVKPSLPWGRTAQTAFGAPLAPVDRGPVAQTILALGEQDTDVGGLTSPPGTEIVGGSSDHLVLTSEDTYPIGTELRFQPNYSALLRAATSPTVDARMLTAPSPTDVAMPPAV